MANKVLSIEIGNSLTKVVEMDYKSKSPKIYSCFFVETPAEMIKDGYVTVNDEFIKDMKKAFNNNAIHTNKAVFTLSSSRIASREVNVPMVKENRIMAIVKNNAADYFPIDLKNYQISYNIVSGVDGPEGKQYKLNVLAAPLDLLDGYYDVAKALGLKVEALDYVGNSIFQAVKAVKSAGVHMIVKIEDTSSIITIINNGVVDLQRTIAYGISDSVNEVAESGIYGKDLTFNQTVEQMRRITCIRRRLDAEDSYREEEDIDQKTTTMRIHATEGLRYLLNNITRVMSYYSSRNNGILLENITLVGTGSDLAGITKLMTDELGVKTKALQNDEAGFTFKSEEMKLNISEIASAIGAAIAPVDLIPDKYKEKKSSRRSYNSPTFGILLALIGAGAIGAMVYMSMTTYNEAIEERNKLQAKIDALNTEGVENSYYEYLARKQEHEALVEMYESTNVNTEDIVGIIKALEDKLPTTSKIGSLSVNASGISFNVSADSKEQVALIIMQLRSIEIFDNVSTGGFSDVVDDNGIHSISLAVTATLKDIVEEEGENDNESK